ncbi:uncharacterized protein K460DRAFT_351836 [Cucurbitaria berberidis CBS 394.84]|uniref:Uncharacterized protein n=1 Tax=Cucurbitaria berberidis CBS 394.84 TaxID=1168544 RepID=A0A9P4GV81_9PLEO|nr:uncharacterized protein K460DRAFT_351836 [Cucurbitaria berberidis CBS 394.84]KAF1851980.1 hypothetical protein K460DRAFT_351836 [Cucurbitaria berberidis CBS 394.84]
MSQEDAMDAALTASDKACMEKADDFKASKVAVEQLPTPASSSSTENPEVPSIKVESTRASRASKRNRETTPDALGPLTPPRSSKKPRTPAKTPAQEEEAVTKKAAALRKKADEAAVKAANAAKRKAAADAKKAETQRKKQVAQWKRDWKDWVTTNQIPDERFTAFEQDCLTVTKSKEYLGIQKDELQCLPHDTRPNPNGPFAPMRLYKYEEVVDLAYKKEAILAGVSQVDDETLIACGKKLWEAKKA